MNKYERTLGLSKYILQKSDSIKRNHNNKIDFKKRGRTFVINNE